MRPWLTLSERLLAAQHLNSVESTECLVGPIDGFVSSAALEAFVACEPADARELLGLLQHPRHRLLVKLLIFATKTVPEPLFEDTVRAGVLTRNVSFNKHFIFPCAILYGRRRVAESLVSIFRHGTDREKCGTAGALYWCSVPRQEMYWPHEGGREKGGADGTVDDLLQLFEEAALEEFLRNPALDVRRALVPWVVSAAGRTPELGARAIAIARDHVDEYIRQRVLCDLGESELIPCLPTSADGSG
ncbi:MAG: hypothetical protein JWM10_636 [Myxococcaceae bacterium]|nr:hypothetical protein [Myxococcaceae bacterium]